MDVNLHADGLRVGMAICTLSAAGASTAGASTVGVSTVEVSTVGVSAAGSLTRNAVLALLEPSTTSSSVASAGAGAEVLAESAGAGIVSCQI